MEIWQIALAVFALLAVIGVVMKVTQGSSSARGSGSGGKGDRLR